MAERTDTGLPNTQVVHLPAYTYGTGLSASANPLSDLFYELESGGVAPAIAHEGDPGAFGLPTQVDVTTSIPKS